ncbi:MAG: TatD family hydrolase [Akkermansia sp.]|nr:TatD family hydrolase [Akkermansia sp.]
MKDYHTHKAASHGGYLCAVTRADWARVAAEAAETAGTAGEMIPCFGVHPWHAHEADAAELAFELDEWLSRYPQACVGESGLDASPAHAGTLEAQRLLLHIHLGAAFRHERMVQLHGVQAWGELLELLRERERCGTLPQVLLHAWNGPHELAREFLKLGVIFSVGLRELSHSKAAERYARIPENRLFPETDDHPEHWGRTLALLRLLRGNLV